MNDQWARLLSIKQTYHSSHDISEAPKGLVLTLQDKQEWRKNVIHSLNITCWEIQVFVKYVHDMGGSLGGSYVAGNVFFDCLSVINLEAQACITLQTIKLLLEYFWCDTGSGHV